MRAKLVAKPCKRKHKKSDAKNVWDLVTGDHLIAKNEVSVGTDDEKVGMALFDRGTKFTKLYASARKTAR
eukprot:8747735-Heterocapsa_arctica.AAC.1